MLESRRLDPLPPPAVAGRVTEVGLLARPVLQSGSKGTVVASFQRCFYATLGGRLICVGAPALGSGPLHVLCERWQADLVRTGEPVTMAGDSLRAGGTVLANVAAAFTWRPDPVPGWSPASLTVGLQATDAMWPLTFGGEALPGPESSARPSHLIVAARPGMDALARIVGQGLEDRRPVSADDADVTGLIGLGPGLTPSGDDFLTGALVALDAVGLPQMRDALWRRCEPLLNRTNEISRAHLEAAARGFGAAVLHAAIHATVAGRVTALDRALSAVSRVGETSGRDAFSGALVVLHEIRRHPDAGQPR